jgi:voltage-gated potassium channel
VGGRVTDHPATGIQGWAQHQLNRERIRPRQAASLIVVVWILAVVLFSVVEHLVDRKAFPTVWAAAWWAIQTVTTVGYGDAVPEQTAGKLVAGILMLGGLALLSVVTATITSGFVAQRQALARASGEDPVIARLDRLDRRLAAIEAELERLRAPAGSG